MTIALYPGSFNPWHEGHTDILKKALRVFDKVIVSAGRNPEKEVWDYNLYDIPVELCRTNEDPVQIMHFTGLLVDFIKELERGRNGGPSIKVDAIIRGLRNGHDLQYEMNQQYWNEDLGLEIPTVYFICDRKLSHISSSTYRMLKKFNGKEKEEKA
jgi:pantetheine-phosphate adenylyltransferase